MIFEKKVLHQLLTDHIRPVQIVLIIILFALYFSPYLINGQDSYILVHDNLDCVNMHGIFDGTFKGSFFPHNDIEEINFPGLQPIFRTVYLDWDKLLFTIFGYFWGFMFNELLYRLLAFVGMFELMRRLKGKQRFPDILLVLLAFSFASLPFWPRGNAAIAGIPLLVVAFHNLYQKRQHLLSLAIIFFIGFYSSLVFIGFFIGIIIIITFIILLSKKKMNWSLFFGALLLLICWVISSYGLLLQQFFSNIPNNRSEYVSFHGGFDRLVKEVSGMFIKGQYHAHSKHTFIILPSFLLICLLFFKKFKNINLVLLGFVYLMISSLAYGLWYYTPVSEYYSNLNFGFNWSRFFVLNPPVWFVIWGLALICIYNIREHTKVITIVFINILLLFIGYKMRGFVSINASIWFVIWGIFMISYFKFAKNYKAFSFIVIMLLVLQISSNVYGYTMTAFRSKPTFRDFFSEQQFDEIEKDLKLNKDNVRIGCIGFFPSVANYNGIKTLGGYKGIYSLKFKRSFYNIIKGELDQNQDLEKYYLEHGFRVYLYDDKIGKNIADQDYIRKNFPMITCEFDVDEMKDMGVTHIFSTSKISNDEENKLRLVYTSKKPEYYYLFYVYQLI